MLNYIFRNISTIIIIAVLMLSTLGCKATPTHVQDSEIIQKNNYINEKYGFSLDLPEGFTEDVEVKEEANIIYFVCRDVQSLVPDFIAGKIGRIEVYDKNQYSKTDLNQLNEMYNFRYIGENKNHYFGWAHATDVQVPPNASNEVKQKYQKLEKKFEEIIKTFKITQN